MGNISINRANSMGWYKQMFTSNIMDQLPSVQKIHNISVRKQSTWFAVKFDFKGVPCLDVPETLPPLESGKMTMTMSENGLSCGWEAH